MDQAMQFVSARTKVVYMTCSLLRQENEDQVEYFRQRYGFKGEGEVLLPEVNGRDGYFVATLTL
jgi:16S rRNA C967 or C1407 C5-methylase (RsmB/RsmF family)